MGFAPSGVRTIGPKTFRLASKSNYASFAYFHFGQSFLCRLYDCIKIRKTKKIETYNNHIMKK